MLYKKFPKEMPADQIKFYRDNIPVTINGTPTDFQKFLKANQKCKDDFYVVQINCIEELAQRATVTKESHGKAQAKLVA